jgi:DNA polymerase-4
VHDELSLTCSVGVAPVKFVAKLASEAAKPRATPGGIEAGLGVKVVTDADLLAFLHALPVRALWGVGPATLERLERLGVSTVGELAVLPVDLLTSTLGNAAGRHLHALANGIDERDVEPERKVKSIGHEETFPADLHERAALDRELARLADSVGARLRAAGRAGRTVSIKVRFHDFRTISRSVTLPSPVDSGRAVVAAARRLLDEVDPAPGVRLLGVSVSQLADTATRQLSLDDAVEADRAGAPGDEDSRWSDASYAMDRIRARFGDAAIGPASVATERGLRVKRQGDQQWGPDEGV